MTNVLDKLTVDLRLNLCLKIVTKKRLYLTRYLQRNSCSLCYFYCDMCSLDRSDTSDEAQVLLLIDAEVIVRQIDAVMNHGQVGEIFSLTLVMLMLGSEPQAFAGTIRLDVARSNDGARKRPSREA